MCRTWNSFQICFHSPGLSLQTIRTHFNVPCQSKQSLFSLLFTHIPPTHMATAHHCAAGCRVGQRCALIGAEETAAQQPPEVHCDPVEHTKQGCESCGGLYGESRQEQTTGDIYIEKKNKKWMREMKTCTLLESMWSPMTKPLSQFYTPDC